jgi:hypothetical protein
MLPKKIIDRLQEMSFGLTTCGRIYQSDGDIEALNSATETQQKVLDGRLVEVIRCGECKKHDTINCPRKHYNEYEYSYFTDFGAEFCEKGERGKQIGIRLNYD